MAKKQSSTDTNSFALLRRLMKTYMRPHIGRLGIAAFFMATGAAMTASLAELMQPVINDVLTAKNGAALLPVSLAIFGAFMLRGASTYFNSVIMNDIGQRVVSRIQLENFEHFMHSDLTFFHRHSSGELISRMTSDIEKMRYAVAEVPTNFGRSTLTLIFLIGVMFQKDWKLAIIAIIIFPIAGMFVSRLGKRIRKVSGNNQGAIAAFSGFMGQVFQSMRHVKAYGMEATESAKANDRIQTIYRLTHKIFRISALSQPITEFLSGIVVGALIYYGGHQVITGHTSSGALLSFITAFLLAYDPIKRGAKLNGVLQTGLASAQRVFSLLDAAPSVVDAADAHALQMSQPTVLLQNVTFSYEADRPALIDATIEVPAGKTVALVGPSGAGKSTVLNLIPRFYDIDSGAVMIGGEDVRTLTASSLRAVMALVSQDVSLFDDTVAANILYGRQGATQAEIIEAAKAAAAHDFIMTMPRGYETMIGENGVMLSGGQRQRLAIARAMLRDAPILLLDEATSALDAESERAVQAGLKRLRQGRTTIVIAHRLSTVMDADIIYVMDRGRIAETGSHGDLINRGGLYNRLYGLQAASGAGDILVDA